MNPPASSPGTISSPAIKVIKSVREDVGEAEWAVRVDLAAFYRLANIYGWTEGLANHISSRAPGRANEFLTTADGMLYEELDASSLVRIDQDGEITYGDNGCGIDKAGFALHSAVYAARADAFCVTQTHSVNAMAVSSTDCGLLPIAQTSMRFVHVANHDFVKPLTDPGERKRLVADLGDHEVIVLRNHGILFCCRTVPSGFNCQFRLERACDTQVMAMNTNAKLIEVPQAILEKTYDKMQPRPSAPNRNGDLAWPAMLRKLDRLDPSYKN